MKCRRLTVLAAALAVAVTLAARPTPARAGTISSPPVYLLTSDHNIAPPSASASGPQVIAMVQPPGGIVPPTQTNGSQGSPLTILPSAIGANGTTYTTEGLDQNHLIVALKDNQPGSNSNQQLFGLSFFNNGLKSLANGGELVFSLNVNSALTSAPQLVSETPGVTITQLIPPAPTSTTTTPPPTTSTTTSAQSSTPPPPSTSVPLVNNPEPMSLALWSILAGAGLFRARAFRRRNAA